MSSKTSARLFFRITLGISVFLSLLLVMLSLTALQVGGKLTVVPQFFSATKETAAILGKFTQLNSISPISSGNEGKGLIDEMLVRYYLEMRYSQIPDAAEMQVRWGTGGPVDLLSLPSIYSKFAAKASPKIDKLPRNVITIDIKRLWRDRNNTFNIDFLIYERFPNGMHNVIAKNVILRFRYYRYRIFRNSTKFNNPYGFTVIHFEETEKKMN